MLHNCLNPIDLKITFATRALGFPKPLALLIGSLAGSLISEGKQLIANCSTELAIVTGAFASLNYF